MATNARATNPAGSPRWDLDLFAVLIDVFVIGYALLVIAVALVPVLC
jgi:hypothetical protein